MEASKIKFGAVLAVLLLASACNLQTSEYAAMEPDRSLVCQAPYAKQLKVGQVVLCIQAVSSSADQAKGLGMRDSMGQAQGMLFYFSGKNSMPAFWMKDMRFDLDLIWIKDGRVVGITKNVAAPKNAQENQDSKLKDYYPPSAIDEVLEVNSGWSELNQVKTGNQVIEYKN